MIYYLLHAVTLLAADAAPTYAQTVQTALSKAAPTLLHSRSIEAGKAGSGIAVVELGIGADGTLKTLRLGQSSGRRQLDAAALALSVDVGALPAPDPTLIGRNGETDCVARVAFSSGKKIDVATACLAPDKLVAEAVNLPTKGDDAAFYLFSGWQTEAAGDLAAAAELYKQAAAQAPSWDLAARAWGLALVQAKRPVDALPFLKTYAHARAGAPDAADYDRKITAFEQQQAARIAEAKKPRLRLGKPDIVLGMRKGYALLEPCLKSARDKRALATGVDTLTFSWSIRKDGSVTNPHLEGPKSLVLTEHQECLESALESWRFPPYTEGSELSVKGVPIKVRGSLPAAPEAPAPAPGSATIVSSAEPGGPATAAEALDEPTFATCERSPSEIGTYIRAHLDKVSTCIAAERRRDASATMPPSLPMAFVVDVDGSVRNIRVNHRFYRAGALATCVSDALSGSLGAAGGADCPAEFAMDISKAGL